MNFMKEYKILDNNCYNKGINGISEYIYLMGKCKNSKYYPKDFKNDYQMLKKYRHIRNKIAHEVGATEESLCQKRDYLWLKKFNSKLLKNIDPLSIYYKNKKILQTKRLFLIIFIIIFIIIFLLYNF